MQQTDLQAQSSEEFKKAGYPLEIFTNKILMEQLVCAICLGVYRDPCALSPCGHSFCKPCVNSLRSSKNTLFSCPRCRASAAGTLQIVDLKVIIKMQTVICPVKALSKKPCSWEGTADNVDSHLIQECQYKIQRCRCGTYLYSDDMLGIDVKCDCPEIVCKFCKKKYYQRYDHEYTCREITEKHKCGAWIKKKELEEHEKTCLETEAVCKYCSFVCNKSRMAFHIQYDCKEVMTSCKLCACYIKKKDLFSHQQGGCSLPKLSGLSLIELSHANKPKVC